MQLKLVEKIVKQICVEFFEGIVSYGIDVLCFIFCLLVFIGCDIKFDMGCVEGFCNFCNKIWNVVNFVIENIDGQDIGVNGELVELFLVDCWIIFQLQCIEQEVICQFDVFCFDLVVQVFYEFIWDEYCVWYLELVKLVLWDENVFIECQCGICCILICVLEMVLCLVYLFMLFIIEEIWQCIKGQVGKEGLILML